MAKYRKKPVVIEAIQWTGDNWHEIAAFCGEAVSVRPGGFAAEGTIPGESFTTIFIRTLAGELGADRGDWIIRGAKGEYYRCQPDFFEATYELVVSKESG